MNNYLDNLERLKYCPNYHSIIETEIYEGDNITGKIIKIYEEFVFNADIAKNETIEKLKNIDEIIMKYLTDHRFNKELANGIRTLKVKSGVSNIIDYIVSKIIDISDEYTVTCTRKIYVPRWI